jgi:hypothetical protein
MWKDKEKKAHHPTPSATPPSSRKTTSIDRIRKDDIREIWVWGAPYFGTDEYAVKIPGDQVFYPTDNPWFYRPYDIPDCGRTVWVHGLQLRSRRRQCTPQLRPPLRRRPLPHRRSRHLGCASRRQKSVVPLHPPADKFPDDAQAGNVHGGPNAKSGYDYGQKETVMSGADDWLNWPDLTGREKTGERRHLGRAAPPELPEMVAWAPPP